MRIEAREGYTLKTRFMPDGDFVVLYAPNGREIERFSPYAGVWGVLQAAERHERQVECGIAAVEDALAARNGGE